MATIEEQLNQLKQDKTVLVQNLVEKGIEASDDETFTELVPKVAEIQSGGNIEEYISSTSDEKEIAERYVSKQFAYRIKKLPDLDFSNLVDERCLQHLFQSLPKIKSLPNIKLGNILKLNLANICSQCEDLQDISNLVNAIKDKKILNLTSAFTNCKNLDYSFFNELDTDELTQMNNTFLNSNLANIPLFNTENVINMTGAFSNCNELTTIPQFNLAKCEKVDSMFNGTNNLESLPELDFSSVKNLNNFLNNSKPNLTSLGGFKNLGLNYTTRSNNNNYYKLDLSYCSALTRESVLNVFNGLADLNTVYADTLYTQQIVLDPTVNSLLQPEDIAIATDKGWNITTQSH